jgi:hypothetical protein
MLHRLARWHLPTFGSLGGGQQAPHSCFHCHRGLIATWQAACTPFIGETQRCPMTPMP